MADLNHVSLIGRLTRDAELKYTAGGFAISNFSIAVNRRRKNGDQWVEEASFFDITLYGKSAENLKQYLVKGKQIAVDGELRQDRWEQDGQPRSKVVIAANNVQLLGGGSSGSSASYGGGASTNYAGASQGSGTGSVQNSAASYQQKYDVGADAYDVGSAYGGGDADFPEDIPF